MSHPSEHADRDFKQFPLCMIPGPVELDDAVTTALSSPASSHVGPHFVGVFGKALEDLRVVFQAPSGQPYIIAGSGTLGWEITATNFIEPGESVLVLNTGLFGDRFGDCLKTYGAQVTHLRSLFGAKASLEDIEKALTSVSKPYKMITITHVDTSSGVLSDVESIAKLVHAVSPSTLIVVDGVCSAGGELIRQEVWGVDIVLTGSQKALGASPGLCILMVSPRGIQTMERRQAPPSAYYASLKRWTPIMMSYEARKPQYFGTPPVQLVIALATSLRQLVTAAGGMDERWVKHQTANRHMKKYLKSRGLKMVPVNTDAEANVMSAVYYPDGVSPPAFLSAVLARGVQIAGGLHPDYTTKYFRIGHMNVSAIEPERGHLDKTLEAVDAAMKECGYQAAAAL
ncbi:2-aminoethylphosphonate---pyruvate transaminase [Synchytrium endobioticum]|nr:2-aminoethylphosphonate---pyruvate transaminase [Synchytrium endobioticum]